MQKRGLHFQKEKVVLLFKIIYQYLQVYRKISIKNFKDIAFHLLAARR